MRPLYQPTEDRPFLFRPIRSAGGLTPLAALAVIVVGGPAILGLCALVWEFGGHGREAACATVTALPWLMCG